MGLKLDLKDWKILSELDKNSRQPDSIIAKKVRLSKQVVNYRIKRLIDENIITGFSAQINISKLGYSAHKIYIQFRSIPKEKEEETWAYLKKHPKIVWIVTCSGQWNLIFGILSKNATELENTLNDFMNRYSQYILNRSISIFNTAILCHRKWLTNSKDDKVWIIGGNIEEVKLDLIDKTILEELSKNARTQLLDIAKKTKTSSTLIIQRIKKLSREGVILGFRLGINREKLGINYCKAFFYYENKTVQKENLLISYCRMLSEIVGISKSIGPWDLELEFEVKNYDEFHKLINEIKNKFSLINRFETVYIDKEYGIGFMPED